ncbi:MAG TPA: hypothetical protein VGX21_02110 [Methylomirabilota bacterium]|jgi:hypothetical protein|nr:hypothetical protein [Methylomirabilota bacterium]
MGPYDHRSVTLDPGLTALALRGLHEREGHYPFIERFRRRRPTRGRRAAPAREARPKPARSSASLWQSLLTLRRVREARGPSSAAA